MPTRLRYLKLLTQFLYQLSKEIPYDFHPNNTTPSGCNDYIWMRILWPTVIANSDIPDTPQNERKWKKYVPDRCQRSPKRSSWFTPCSSLPRVTVICTEVYKNGQAKYLLLCYTYRQDQMSRNRIIHQRFWNAQFLTDKENIGPPHFRLDGRMTWSKLLCPKRTTAVKWY
jgi:hypothetical protein